MTSRRPPILKNSRKGVFPVLAILVACAPFLATPILRAQAQTDAAPPGSADLARRIDDLQKQLTDLRREMAAREQSGGSPTAATVATQTAGPQASGTSATPPLSATLAGLLGPTSLSGFLDVYYNYNSNQPNSRGNGFRSFDVNSAQFALNLLELDVDKAPGAANSRTGYHIALGFGQAMNAVNGSDPGGLGFDQYLKEAYFSYLAPVGKGFQIDAGKFVTPHGAEVIETKDNWNYSRGLLFSYAIPYFHFGLRAKYAFNDKYALSGFLVNGWNSVVDNNTGKTYGLGFGWNPTKKVGFTQNYMAGPEQSGNNSNWRQLWDTVAIYSPTDKLSFTANFDYGLGDRIPGAADPVFWTGIAGYVRYAFNNKYALATRYEYYDDHDGFTTGMAQHFNEFTETFQRMIAGHILSRLEFRRDGSSRPTFVKGTVLPVNAQNTVTAGLVYTFDSREAQ